MKLKGLIAAVHTPMHDDFNVNYDRVPAQAEHLAKGGASGAFVTGTTGESHSLTTEERLRMFDAWGQAAHRNGLKFIAHVGHNNLPDAQALVRSARDSGADAISAMAPNFFKPADAQSLCDWFVKVTKPAPELPFYFYDIPSMTGVMVETDVFLDIAKERLPGFVGVKFTNQDYDLLQRCMANTSVKKQTCCLALMRGLLRGWDSVVSVQWGVPIISPRLFTFVLSMRSIEGIWNPRRKTKLSHSK
jgi:N-acetylneuraminate lyase